MESYRLNSRIVDDKKEYLIQTMNDTSDGVIKTTLFVNGEILDAMVFPHADEIGEEEILNLVKCEHGEKKSELEYLLKSYKEVLRNGRPEMMYHLGTALYYKRMYSEARHLFQTALELKHDYHECFFFLSRTELALGHAEEAVKAGSRAVELRQNYADYRNALGEALLESSSCKRAVIEFEEAIRKNVYYADAYFNLAMTYIQNAVKKEDYHLVSDLKTKCMDMLKKAVLIYPAYESSDFDRATAALKAGDLKGAYNLLMTVRESKKEKQRLEQAVYFHRFLIYTDWLSENHIADRIAYLEREINKNPDYVDLYYELAVCHLHQARFQWQKGINNFQKALAINPDLKKANRAYEMARDHSLKLNDAITGISDKNTILE
nr:tetratricopeptide repeat protein [candidate division Zixibacteria bacterium]